MANKNPNPATRFQKGSAPPGGRPKGTRDKLSTAFISALADSFEKHGMAALDKVRTEDTSTYIRVIASLQPKEVELKAPLDAMDDGTLLEAISALTQAIRGHMPPADPEEKRVIQ